MALEIPDSGLTNLIEILKKTWNNVSAAQGVKIKLFKNDYTPVPASVISDFTEANFTGYSSQAVGTSWSGGVVDSTAHTVTTIAPSVTFSQTGTGTTNTVYGYYAINTSSGELLWAERFASSEAFTSVRTFVMTPSFTLNSKY